MTQSALRGKGQGPYLIGHVAEAYGLHPQTLRLYERLGLLRPSRSNGRTRLYGPGDLERLETILELTRERGINLAGVRAVLDLRERIDELKNVLSTRNGSAVANPA